MLTGSNNKHLLLLGTVLLLLLCCTPGDFIKPNPPPSLSDQHTSGTRPSDSLQHESVIDFADAFDTSIALDSSYYSADATTDVNHRAIYNVPVKKVRVAIARNIRKGTVYSAGEVLIHSGKGRFGSSTVRGRILFESNADNVTITTSFGRQEVHLPCTLSAENEYSYLDVDNVTYRGLLIVVPGDSRGITLVNTLDVEEYLRGVLPLEMGKRSTKESEALKAQAVAARTYTYKKIVASVAKPFDLVNTVADQVYGGASVEYRESDAAIKATCDKILVHDDSIAFTYYHSTCGGTTATIDDVWKKPPQPYLRSISDTDPLGEAYCSDSKYFTWKETWSWRSFTSIVHNNLKKQFPNERFVGPVTNVGIEERFPCNRVKRLVITGKGWVKEVRGDELRFILRREGSHNPILRSARIKIDTADRTSITILGKGYGHGVGLCQMGALGRARAGQDYITILTAYYTGVTLATVEER